MSYSTCKECLDDYPEDDLNEFMVCIDCEKNND